MQRRTIVLIGGFAVIIVLAVIISVYIFQDSGETANEPSETTTQSSPFPFGGLIDRLSGRTQDDAPPEQTDISGIAGGPSQVVTSAQAGYIFTPQGTLRYVERDTGRIFEQTTSGNTTRLTNTTLPRIRRAVWSPDGESLLLQQQEQNSTRVITIRAQLEENTTESLPGTESGRFILEGETLPNTIADFSVSPDGSRIAFLHTTPQRARVTTQAFLENQATEIFESPHTSWLLDWNLPEDITLVPKPAQGVVSGLYLINTQNASLERPSQGNALTALVSPDGTSALITKYTEDNVLMTLLEDYENRTTTVLPFVTYPALKCTYTSPSRVYCGASAENELLNYPEDWYQGQVIYGDNLWTIDVPSKTSRILYNTQPDTLNLDIIHISKHPAQNVLYFENKADNSIWSFRL